MQNKILILFLLICFSRVFSQTSNDRIIYFDSLHNVTDETNYKSKRIIKDFFTDKDVLETSEYYKSGGIKMKGVYVDRYDMKPIGMFITYYENGNRESLTNLPAFGSTNKTASGKIFEWHENGNKKSETEISFSKRTAPSFKVLKYWDKNENIKITDGNGEFEEEDKEGWTKGLYVDGYKEGAWIGKNYQYNFTFTENYKKGKLISGKSTDSNQVEHSYSFEQKDAVPKKGLIDFKKHLNRQIQNYADNLSENSIIDRFLKFTINPDGKISDIKIIKGSGDTIKDDINELLIKILKNYENWEPYEMRGNIVKQEHSEPIFFRKN